MFDAAVYRPWLIASSILLFAAVTVAFVWLEVPGLGIGHFYLLAIALLALAGDWRVGIFAGALATGLYAAGVLLNPAMPSGEVFTVSAVIRGFTWISAGALLGVFAAQKRNLVSRLADLAERDFLTGLFNLRAFEESLSARCAQRRSFTLLLGDLDGLKAVNDQLGHAEGNALLRRTADALTAAVREGDEIARVGGDEFAVLAAAGSPAEAEGLRRRLEEVLERDGLRVSFGWALHPIDGSSPIALYRRADERLYSSKAARKSREHVAALLSLDRAG